MPKPTVRFRIQFSSAASVGPGKIELLERIHASGSLSQGARDLGMSYRRAWRLTASLNASFDTPVTVASTGGRGGGGATVTPFGLEIVRIYRALETEFDALARRRLRSISPKSRKSAKAPARPRARRPAARQRP